MQITGIGGVGKSRLAAEIVNTQTYAGGAVWHDCRAASLTGLAATIREQLGLGTMANEQTWAELDNYAVLAETAHRHPYLMEHAASWLTDMSVKDVLTELESKSADTQEALNEMIAKSVERVRDAPNGETAIAVLRKLAVCRGGFTTETAKAIVGEEDFGKSFKQISTGMNPRAKIRVAMVSTFATRVLDVQYSRR